MSSADRRSPPGLCGSRIHLGGRVAKQLQNAFSIYFFFPAQPASGADRRTSEDTNFAASFEGLLGPNQGYFSSIFSMADVGSRFFFLFLGSETVVVLSRPLAGFSRRVETGPLSLCHQIQFDCLRVNPQRRIIA